MSRRTHAPLLLIGLLLLCVSLVQAAEGPEFLRRELRLNEFTASGQGAVSLGMAADGELLAAWESRRQLDGRYGVFARRVDAEGRLRSAELPVALNSDSHRRHPVVTWAGDSQWLLWEAWGQDGEAGAIIARRSDGDEVLLNSTR